ncbi:MAG: protein-glutamate O-methyltransferase CheR [Bacillota bacterium]|nr:protein-glutamate O-methyltransferase CheR [Bacillota bacterium]
MENYEGFKQKVFKLTKLDLNSYKEKQMKRRIESLIARRRIDNFDDYFKLISTDSEAFDEFINFLTINVSEFYRNDNQWAVLKSTIIPDILARNKRPKIWSAACSTGEEPYSLVMLMSDFMPLKDIKIFACDFDTGAIAKAKAGIYTEKSIAKVPDTFKTKYFESTGRGIVKISDAVKAQVEFKKMNLLLDPYPQNYDLIVCRNVMIYFTDEAKDEMYRKFHDSLVPNGYLFVGSTEQIIQPARYGFETDKTFFYKRKK